MRLMHIFSDFHKIALDSLRKYMYNKSRMFRSDIRSIFLIQGGTVMELKGS